MLEYLHKRFTEVFPGKGYQMATDSGATLAFTGTVDTDATETISIESFTDASGRRWIIRT